MNLVHLRNRLKNPKISPLTVAYLENHQLVFSRYGGWGGGVASVEKKQGNRVYGAVFDLSMEEIAELDKYEGYYGEGKDNAYVRKETIVTSTDDNTKLKVLIYIAIRESDRDYPPSKEYLTCIIEGAKQCNLPPDYIEQLKKIKTKEY